MLIATTLTDTNVGWKAGLSFFSSMKLAAVRAAPRTVAALKISGGEGEGYGSGGFGSG